MRFPSGQRKAPARRNRQPLPFDAGELFIHLGSSSGFLGGVLRQSDQVVAMDGRFGQCSCLVTADLLRCILRDERRVLTVSRMPQGAFGLTDVALSLPAVVGSQGAAEVLEPEISAEEQQRLHHSADVLRKAAVGASAP